MEFVRNVPFRASGIDVDITFCIGGTVSLGDVSSADGLFSNVWKRGVRGIYSDFIEAMHALYRPIGQLRIRLVLLRDHSADNETAMMVTDFFRFPQQIDEFEASLKNVQSNDSRDVPQNGLEAVGYAIKSKWTNSETIFGHRHLLVVLTDVDTRVLDCAREYASYPEGMLENMDELTEWWEDPANINQIGKRLILVAPNKGCWKYISDNWDNVLHYPSIIGNALVDVNYAALLDIIVHAV